MWRAWHFRRQASQGQKTTPRNAHFQGVAAPLGDLQAQEEGNVGITHRTSWPVSRRAQWPVLLLKSRTSVILEAKGNVYLTVWDSWEKPWGLEITVLKAKCHSLKSLRGRALAAKPSSVICEVEIRNVSQKCCKNHVKVCAWPRILFIPGNTN